MFVKPSSAFVEKPSLVASSSGSAKKARYARLLPSTRKSSESRAGASSSCSSAPVSVFGIGQRYRPAAMPELDIQPFSDEHLDAAAGLLEERHRAHREAEPLLPDVTDFRAEVEDAWRATALPAGSRCARRAGGYLIGSPRDESCGGRTSGSSSPATRSASRRSFAISTRRPRRPGSTRASGSTMRSCRRTIPRSSTRGFGFRSAPSTRRESRRCQR